MRFTRGSYKMRQKPCDALNFAPVCCCASLDMLQAFYSVQIFASDRSKTKTCFFQIFSEHITPNLANIMQFADVSFGLMQILCDGKVPSNELLLHKPCSAQVQAAKCIKMLQIPSNFAHILRSLEIPTHQATKILYADLFSLLVLANHFQPLHLWLLHRGMLTHRDAFAHGCFYTEMLFAETCFHTHTHTNLVLLHTNAFMHRCFFYRDAFICRSFYTQMRRHFYTQMPLHSDAFTPEFFYTLL